MIVQRQFEEIVLLLRMTLALPGNRRERVILRTYRKCHAGAAMGTGDG